MISALEYRLYGRSVVMQNFHKFFVPKTRMANTKHINIRLPVRSHAKKWIVCFVDALLRLGRHRIPRNSQRVRNEMIINYTNIFIWVPNLRISNLS